MVRWREFLAKPAKSAAKLLSQARVVGGLGAGAGDTGGRGGEQLWSNEQILGTSPAPAHTSTFIH